VWFIACAGHALTVRYVKSTGYCNATLLQQKAVLTSPSGGVRSVVMSMSVCLCVCLSVHSHNSKTVRPNFSNCGGMLPVAVARSSSGGVAICYVHPVLWMTSCFTSWNQSAESRTTLCLEEFARWRYQFHVRQYSVWLSESSTGVEV